MISFAVTRLDAWDILYITNSHHMMSIAECLAYGTYSAVYVPGSEDVSCKEYIRMRSDFKAAQKRVKQQIKV